MRAEGCGNRARRAGYTVVELLMSLTVLALGASGVVAMQRVTLESNRYAKNLAIATRVGETWADQLEADAARWTLLSPISNTTWLNIAGACSQTAGVTSWFQPTYDTDRKFGAAFDALGNPVDMSITTPNTYTQFCVHLRLAWLHCDAPVTLNGGPKGSGIIRAEVRVFWRRDDDRSVNAAAYQTTGQPALCSATDVAGVTNDIGLGAYNAVYFSTAIRQAPE